MPELSWVTAADGTVTIDDLPTSHILRLRIETPQHGAQSIRLDVDKLADEATVTLVPVCRVEIALVLDDTSRLSDREVTIDSRSPREASPSEEALIRQIWPWGGNAFARTDASGKATVVVPAGELRAQVKRLADERQFPADATPVQGQPGQTVSLPIPFKPGMKLTGACRLQIRSPSRMSDCTSRALTFARATTGLSPPGASRSAGLPSSARYPRRILVSL